MKILNKRFVRSFDFVAVELSYDEALALSIALDRLGRIGKREKELLKKLEKELDEVIDG